MCALDTETPNDSECTRVLQAMLAQTTIESPDRTCRFEAIAKTAAAVCESRQGILEVLLQATLPPKRRGRAVLAPLWACEAMQRAYDMVRLVARLDRFAPLGPGSVVAAELERRLAQGLATTLHALDVPDDDQFLPCSHPLRALARDLVELFGPTAGHAELRTSIEPLLLPAYKCKALVLACCALLTDAMCNRPFADSGGRITVALSRIAGTRALLRVADTGRYMRRGHELGSLDVVDDLASLLECEPVYRTGVAGVAIELVFPVGRAPRAGGPDRPFASLAAFAGRGVRPRDLRLAAEGRKEGTDAS